jgi:hypothetical protein
MRAIFVFSDNELECLQSNSFQWLEAITPIAKQMVADETSAELATAREESLGSSLSPKERQELYEVCPVYLCLVSCGLKGHPGCAQLVSYQTSSEEKDAGGRHHW